MTVFDNARAFNSEKVSYMKKVFNDTVLLISPICAHYLQKPHCPSGDHRFPESVHGTEQVF